MLIQSVRLIVRRRCSGDGCGGFADRGKLAVQCPSACVRVRFMLATIFISPCRSRQSKAGVPPPWSRPTAIFRFSSPVPRRIVTDQLRSYPTANAEIPELTSVKHVFVNASARLHNRAQNSHQPTREREHRVPKGTSFRACADFETRNAPRPSSRTSGRSGNASTSARRS